MQGIIQSQFPVQDHWPLDEVLAELRTSRQAWCAAHSAQQAPRVYPSREVLQTLVRDLAGVMFPLWLGPAGLSADEVDLHVALTLPSVLDRLSEQVGRELAGRLTAGAAGQPDPTARQLVGQFARQIPALKALLDADALAAYQGDPAAHSIDEVLLCYPGFLAIIHHRLAHQLYRLGAPLVARIITEIAHSLTGIDIHPGATIGPGFFIDHGTGVVIGETAIIGRNVRMYQGVILGTKRFSVNETGELVKGLPRHPVVEDGVVIYAGATVLGRITIGQGSSIGSNVRLTHSVAPGSHIIRSDHDIEGASPHLPRE
ncbi:serine O-acetyltransferase EpsC [Paludibacterium sp.]|uniref:serine O-acetyltransferase EpsC n=1 Tax=Paludibacterium sp. TaxID=1917523 RepID=UPI0025D4413A|nr:serine O-acetyltransferase EpsC [Paludibacterium sp.]MBV8648675.1 serine acetyltransferase [Paludibacterium sp.]